MVAREPREPRDPREPVDFSPVRIGPRRTGPDPLAIGAVLVAIGLVVAIVKPWDVGIPAASPSPDRESPQVSAGPSRPQASGPAIDPEDPEVARAMLAALGPHVTWGVRALLDGSERAGRIDFVERWQPVAPSSDPTIVPLVVQPQGPVRAIGVSAPLDETPLAMRVWQEEPGQVWRWLDVRHPPSSEPTAELLLMPPRTAGAPAIAWPEGRYRIDLLMGSYVARVDVTVGSPVYPAPPEPTEAVDRGMAWLGNVPAGPFAVIDGRVTPLAGGPGRLLELAEAWLDVDAVVASTDSTVTVLGVLLPAGSSDPRAVIRRLAPDPVFDGPVATTGLRFDTSNDPMPYVRFALPRGEVFAPGTYALEVDWSAADGPHQAAWHIELRPGPEVARTQMAIAARRYAPFVGGDAIVLSGISRGDEDPAAVPVRRFPMAAEIGCAGPPIEETPAVIGITHQPDRSPERVDAVIVGSNGRTQALRLRLFRDVVPGLSLIAPSDGPRFGVATYRFRIAQGGSVGRDVTICIGGPRGT